MEILWVYLIMISESQFHGLSRFSQFCLNFGLGPLWRSCLQFDKIERLESRHIKV